MLWANSPMSQGKSPLLYRNSPFGSNIAPPELDQLLLTQLPCTCLNRMKQQAFLESSDEKCCNGRFIVRRKYNAPISPKKERVKNVNPDSLTFERKKGKRGT